VSGRAPDIDWAALRATAEAARAHAHAPYSGFRVGAALLAEDGRVFAGANCENASYPLGLCAERAAVAAAVTAGARRFLAIAVVAGGAAAATPCGGCRQVLAEFAPSFEVRCYAAGGDAEVRATVAALLPAAFDAGLLASPAGLPAAPSGPSAAPTAAEPPPRDGEGR
jgi:cytidine deaminase